MGNERSQKAGELARLRMKVHDLELRLKAEIEGAELLRAQNDYLRNLLFNPDHDTQPQPEPEEPPTRPSSPKAIKKEEILAAECGTTYAYSSNDGWIDPDPID